MKHFKRKGYFRVNFAYSRINYWRQASISAEPKYLVDGPFLMKYLIVRKLESQHFQRSNLRLRYHGFRRMPHQKVRPAFSETHMVG